MAPTHVLGEEVVSDDNVLLIEDPGVGGHHGVDPGVWGELVGEQDLSGNAEGESHRQDKGEHLPLLSSSVPLPREEVDGCGPEGMKSSPAPCLAGASPGGGEKRLPLGQGQGWAVPQRLLDNGPKHRHLGDILSTRKPVSRHNGFQFLVQGLLDAWVPGEVVQGPGQRVGGLGKRSTERSEGERGWLPEQPRAKHGTSTAPDCPCSGAQGS